MSGLVCFGSVACWAALGTLIRQFKKRHATTPKTTRAICAPYLPMRRVGEQVGCRIYPLRPAPCHARVEGRDGCMRARAKLGLPALETL